MKGAVKTSKAFQKWTDEYLITSYGDHIVGVEAKKEKTHMDRKFMTLKDYIHIYETRNVFSVTTLDEEMK